MIDIAAIAERLRCSGHFKKDVEWALLDAYHQGWKDGTTMEVDPKPPVGPENRIVKEGQRPKR